MKWQIKFLKNSLFGLLPFPQKLRELKRKIIPYPSDVDEYTLEQGIQQVEMLRSVGCPLHEKVALEIGTGWQPIIPLVFYLVGCKKVILVDRQKLMDERLLYQTCSNLLVYSNKLSERLQISPVDIRSKLGVAKETDFNDNLARLRFNYLAPCDILRTDLPYKSIDIIISRAVLEHIPPGIVSALFKKSYELLRDNGRMCHIIDNSDHWEHQDKSILQLNFLKFSDMTFRMLSAFNPLDYQNRLRHSDYVELLKASGFRIDLDLSRPNEKAMADLRKIKLNKKFRNLSLTDLAILESYIVASKDLETSGKESLGVCRTFTRHVLPSQTNRAVW